MYCTLKQLTDYSLCGRDGALGSVDDVIVDEQDWSIRYLLASTGNWLMGRKVLLDRVCLAAVDSARQEVVVALTKDEIKQAPGEESDLPVSKQNRAKLAYAYSWAAPAGDGMLIAPSVDQRAAAEEESDGQPNLRSIVELTGYAVLADKTELGELEDVLILASDWSLQQFIVKPKKSTVVNLLLTPKAIKSVDWTERVIRCDDDVLTMAFAV